MLSIIMLGVFANAKFARSSASERIYLCAQCIDTYMYAYVYTCVGGELRIAQIVEKIINKLINIHKQIVVL